MALSKARYEIGTTHYAYERAAVQFLVDALPDRAPYHLFALKDLATADGRRYEIDAIVVAPKAVFLVEIKSHPAHFKGDMVDWRVEWKDGRLPSFIENPVRLTATKARVLASALDRKLGASDRPYVQPLVFLSDERASVDSNNGADFCVVTRHNVIKALTDGTFPGATAKVSTNTLDTPRGQRVVQALLALGLRNPKEQNSVAGYTLGDLLDDGSGWQDHAAHAEQVKGRSARVRIYTVPAAVSLERREQLVRAALREAEVLNALSDHPNILHLQTSLASGPGGAPCLLFDRYDDELDLETFLRRNPALPFSRQVELVEQVGNALAFCHRKGVLHRGLDPNAVLVRRLGDASTPEPERALSVRLLNFQLASHEGITSGTHHLSAFGADRNLVYRAPEVLQDPRHAREASDVFSLGALAYRVFTGRSPGATLAERALLMRAGHLSLAAAREGLGVATPPRAGLAPEGPGSLDELIASATHVDPLHRIQSANDFVGFFLDVVTRPEPEAPKADPDPLEARPGDVFGDGLRVVQYLGSGATAKVFRVERAGETFALKVALDGEHEERLTQEAAVLDRLRSERIVALHARLTLGGRLALLLDDAGESLAELLQREGAQSLDYARRWGDDLLLALEAIEGTVQHRDIKPANVGVLEPGSKKRRHLKLFDFSLSGLAPEHVTAGTPAYRDPFLATRGCWDEHADRYAAAVSLHELVTGLRPRWGDGDGPVRPGDALAIDAERFDAAVRDRMVDFFRRALDRDADARFTSAEAMRVAWSACFVAPVRAQAPAIVDAPPPRITDAALAALRPDSPLEAIGLSARARNALDRSGIVTAAQLARVSDNLLSSIRGIGRDTAREIQDVCRRLQGVEGLSPVEEPAFDAGFVGDDLPLTALKLPEGLRASLDDAGLRSLADLAAAPTSQVEHLARPHGGDAVAKLRAALKEARDAVERTADPRTVEAWLDALFDPRQRHPNQKTNYQQTVWRWMGLDPTVEVDPGDTIALAEKLQCTRQNVSIMLGRARDKWAKHAKIDGLVERVRADLDGLDGVARIDRAAEALAAQLPHEPGAEGDALAARRAECLVAVARELAGDLALERVHGPRWVARDRRVFATLRALGACADALAAKSPLPSSAEVLEELTRVVAASPLSALAPDRLVALAADASTTAARSARLELYPHGMDARRALALCHGVLSGERDGLTEAQLRDTVLARYPEAEALPPRPALDALVEDALRLTWDNARARWRRPAAPAEPSSTLRSEAAPVVLPTLLPDARPARRSPEQQEAWEFDDALTIAARRGDLRVFTVAPSAATAVAARVAERLGTTAQSLDAALLAEVDALVAKKKINPEVVIAADREGPAGRHWLTLRKLVVEAADTLAARWTNERGALVLGDLGLAARFNLGALLQSLLDATRRDDGRAVFVVVPRFSEGAGASIDGGALPALPVPVFSPGQRMEVPRAWVENRHRGAD
jgi:serine/threonine protein kinase